MNQRAAPPGGIARQVQAMLSAMRHRGPDGQADYVDGNLGMGANRLAIRGVEQRRRRDRATLSREGPGLS
jgi:asparagine synthetase B (glutamine-hydrolysing)